MGAMLDGTRRSPSGGTASAALESVSRAPNAREILKRALASTGLGFFEGEAQIGMVHTSNAGEVLERRFRWTCFRGGRLKRVVVRVLHPDDVAGQCFMWVDNPDRDTDVWVHMATRDLGPRLIPDEEIDTPFLQGNLTYADLAARQLLRGALVRQPDEHLGRQPAHVVDITGTSAYRRARLWARPGDFLLLRLRYFGADGQALKTIYTETASCNRGFPLAERCRVVACDGSSTCFQVEHLDVRT